MKFSISFSLNQKKKMKQILILLSFCLYICLAQNVYSVLYSNGQYNVIQGYSEYSVAMATYERNQDATGWNHLKISVVKSSPLSDLIKMVTSKRDFLKKINFILFFQRKQLDFLKDISIKEISSIPITILQMEQEHQLHQM